ncbi:MAG: c-type cytochrome [Nitrospirae bacterium]|nr:c-type cytochrome [Nitrospirota bacterium]
MRAAVRILLLVWMMVHPSLGVAGELDASTGPSAPDEVPSKKLNATPEGIEAGKKIYERRCLPCHGVNGAGDGPAADVMDPRPRDFTRGLFKLRSTAFNELPTDEDLYRTISRGIPGSGMPSWKRLLSEEERLQVIAYIKTFSDKFKNAPAPKMIPVGTEPPATAETIKKGKELFEGKASCFLCHGKGGRGNGPISVATMDAWNNPLYPRNLTKSWSYKGGNDVKDIFLRISGSLNGTPMPAFLETLTEEERWSLAQYVKSLQRPVPTGSKVVIESRKVSGEISLDPNAPIWKGADPVDVLMSGQVHLPPRNQSPTVDFVVIQSVYNDKEIAFRLEWDDRTQNITQQDSEAVQKMETPDFTATYPVLYPPSVRLRNLRDAAALQFAVRLPQGPEKPHFFLGDTGKSVNLWEWKADLQKVEELNAKGYKTPPTLQPPDSQQAEGKGVFDDGVWRVVMKRPLTTKDVANDVQFATGQLIPVAVHIWDGANGETGLRRTISSWYFVVLTTGMSVGVYLYTGAAVLLVAGLEFWLIRKTKGKTK